MELLCWSIKKSKRTKLHAIECNSFSLGSYNKDILKRGIHVSEYGPLKRVPASLFLFIGLLYIGFEALLKERLFSPPPGNASSKSNPASKR